MSKIGNYRVGLQERPEYQEGWFAHERGDPCDCAHSGEAEDAWHLGYSDAERDLLEDLS